MPSSLWHALPVLVLTTILGGCRPALDREALIDEGFVLDSEVLFAQSPIKGTKPFTVPASSLVDDHIEPLPECTIFGYTKPPMDRDFDLIMGSFKSGNDAKGVLRPPWAGDLKGDSVVGQIQQVNAGYGLFAGTGPIGRGRRIRAASDGTIWALEVLEGSKKERFYLLAIAAGHSVVVTVDVEGNPPKTFTLTNADLDKYIDVVEAQAAGYAPVSVSDPKTDPAIKYFSDQMKEIMVDERFPRPEYKGTLTAAEFFKHRPEMSLLERFVERFGRETVIHFNFNPKR